MTVTYSLKVSSCSLLSFAKLLLRWRGSIYQLVYKEFLLYIFTFYLILLVYRFAMPEIQQRKFEQFAEYCLKFTDSIPLTFVLGFFVSLIIERWWSHYMNIPWPDKACYLISAYIKGSDEKARMIRRTLARYVNLMACFTFQNISMKVKKRFPTVDHIEKAGLITVSEKEIIEKTSSPHGNWWFPAAWFVALVNQAMKEGRIEDKTHLRLIIEEMLLFRGLCGNLFGYDWISIPLVYTQVVTLATYTFFGACLFGRQQLIKGNNRNDIEILQFLPIYTFFQYFVYMGWLKVAEQLINPLGEDEDDYETNYLIDRNINVSYLIVDTLYDVYPELTRDIHWTDVAPTCLTYTTGAINEIEKRPMTSFLGSTADVEIDDKDQEIISREEVEKVILTTIAPQSNIVPSNSQTNLSMSTLKYAQTPSMQTKFFNKLNKLVIGNYRQRSISGNSFRSVQSENINVKNHRCSSRKSLQSAQKTGANKIFPFYRSLSATVAEVTKTENEYSSQQLNGTNRFTGLENGATTLHIDEVIRKALDTVEESDDTITSNILNENNNNKRQ